MPHPRYQQSAWQTRNTQTTGGIPSVATHPSTSSSAPTSTVVTSSSTSTTSSSKVPPHRWNSVVKFDSKVPIAPSAPEAVTPPPPPNAYRGARHHHHSIHQTTQDQSKDSTTSDSPLVKFVCNVTVTLKEAGMSNSDTPRLIRIMDEQLFNRQQKGQSDTVYFISLDVSGNSLTCEAIQQISVSPSYDNLEDLGERESDVF